MLDFVTGRPVLGDLTVRWAHGVRSRKTQTEPKIQVHRYDEHTYLLRQSKAVQFEAPFLYLLFGDEGAILFDTGATPDADAFPLRETIDGLVAEWLDQHPHDTYRLVVAHSHAHRDHVAADDQFRDRPDTTVVGADLAAVQAYFGFSDWPAQVVPVDLGGRVLEMTGIPGHHAASVAVFDPWTGFLLTGDTVYPGRLYAFDMATFAASMDRLVAFADARPVTHVMGGHIEMSRTPGRDYPMGSTYQPDEPPLQMTVAQLHAVRDATHRAAGRPGVHVFDDFLIFNGTGRTALPKLLARTIWQRIRS
jgi:hydroxyacylglutathione hydrolase